MFRRRNVVINGILVIVLGVVGFFGWQTLYPKAAVASARTATVATQDVSTSVSATGTVQAAVDLGVNFATNGIVRQINVKVGDKVKKGKALATIDDRAAKLSLLQSQSSEANAEQTLVNAKNSVGTANNAVTNAEVALTNAEAAVTQGASAAVITLANSDQSIANAQAALTKLQAGPTAAALALQVLAVKSQQTAIDNANLALANAGISLQQLQTTVGFNLTAYNQSIDRTYTDYKAKCDLLATSTDCTTYSTTLSAYRSWQDALQAKVVGVAKDAQSLVNAQNSIDTAKRNVDSAQAQMETLLAQQAQTNAPPTQIDVDSANAAIATAQRAKVSAQAQIDQQKIQLAGAVVTAQTSLANSKVGVENAQASVSSATTALTIAQASLANAQTALDNTTLVAPISGTVAAIASAVGVNAGSTSAGSGGGSGFIVLTDLTGLQVSASFAEADIVALKPGQVATITFDAIAGASATGEVLSIAPLNTASTGNSGSVTSYAVTFSMTDPPAGVKPGMTAQVTVVTAEALGVLAVTSTALTQRGGIYTVTMKPTKVGAVGVRKTVTIGLKGDTATEITSGLKEGDEVELRTTSTSSASNGFPTGGIPGGIPGGGGTAVRVGG
jgi:multidrug efflux pump subunit AcrA (membrane-fusion protein)